MDLFQNILYFLTTIIVSLTAISILIYNAKSKVTRAFFFYLISTALWLISLYLAIPTYEGYTQIGVDISARVAYGSSALVSYFIFIFLYQFGFSLEEIQTSFFKKYSKFISIIIGILTIETVLFTLISIFTPLIYTKTVIHPDQTISDVFGPLIDWSSYHHYLYFLLDLIIPSMKIFYAKGLLKRKLLLLFLSYVACYGITILCNVILPNFGIAEYYIWGGIATAPFSLITLYIIAQYRFLGTQFIITRVLRIITALTFSIIVTYMYVTYVYTIAHFSYYIHSIITSSIAIGVFLSTYHIFLRFEHSSTFQKEVMKLIEELKFIHTFEEFTNKIKNTFPTLLHIQNIEIFITEKHYKHSSLPFYEQNQLTELLYYEKKPVVREEITFSEKPLPERYYQALVYLGTINASVCIPLFFQSKLLGFLAIGSKHSKEMYFREELDSLMKLSNYIAMFLVNEALQNKNRENIEELERTKEVAKDNQKARRLMHDMKNSVQSALAIVREIKSQTNNTKVWQIEESLWDMEDSLSLKDEAQIQKKVISIKDFFEGLLATYHDLYAEKNIVLSIHNTTDEDDYLYADRRRLKSIFENLLHNAYKFTPSGKEVTISISYTKNTFHIHVINTGISIPKKDKKRIFIHGYTSDKNRGSGIGLATVREYLTQHNATIEEVGSNDTVDFFISFPKASPDIFIFPSKTTV